MISKRRTKQLATLAVFCLLNGSLSALAASTSSGTINPPSAGATDPLTIRKAFKLERDPLVSLIHQDESVEYILRGLAQKANLNLIFMVDGMSTPPQAASAGSAEEDPLLALEGNGGGAAPAASGNTAGGMAPTLKIPYIELKNVPVSEAFALVLQMSGLTGRRVYNSILITTPEKMSQMGFAAPLIKTYRIYNQLPSQIINGSTAPTGAAAIGGVLPPLVSQLQSVFESRGVRPVPKMMMDARTATLVLVGSQEAIDIADQLIPVLDRPLPQVLVEVKLIELTQRGSQELGVSYGFGQDKVGAGFNNNTEITNLGPGNPLTAEGEGIITFGSLSRFAPNFNARLNALIRDSQARVLTNPRLTIQHGVTATFDSTTLFPILSTTTTATTATQTVQSIPIGEKMEITPFIDTETQIVTMHLRPEISTRGEIVSVGAQAIPEQNRRLVATMLRVKDGESVIIGGLMRKSNTEVTSKIPLLGDIPILGGLFSSTSKAQDDVEILIMVTPRILATE